MKGPIRERKEERIFTTRASVSLAVLNAIINNIEDIIEEYNLNINDLSLRWGSVDSILNPSENIYIKIYYKYNLNINKNIDINNININISINEGYGDMGFLMLYDLVEKIILQDAFEYAIKASYTTRTGIEFIFYYLDDGRIAMFEGEYHRVRLPKVRAVASIHTHPEGACGLSKQDIESGLDLLAEGGLLLGAATTSCMAVMRRRFMVSEEDYLKIKEYLLNKKINFKKLDTVVFNVIRY